MSKFKDITLKNRKFIYPMQRNQVILFRKSWYGEMFPRKLGAHVNSVMMLYKINYLQFESVVFFSRIKQY